MGLTDDAPVALERRRCDDCGKAIYTSRSEAQRGIRGIQARHKKHRPHIFVCPYGRGFHIGNHHRGTE